MSFSSLSGGELFDRIAAEDYKMSEAEVINYMRQVCEGLKNMHERSIVHLDIKVCLNQAYFTICCRTGEDTSKFFILMAFGNHLPYTGGFKGYFCDCD